MDRRTITAIILSLAVYWLWWTWVSTNPPVIVEDAAVADASPTEKPSTVVTPPTTPTVGNEETVAGLEPLPTLPIEKKKFDGCDVSAFINTDGGALSTASLDNYQAPFETQALWSWLLGKLTGEPGSWHPYGETEPGRVQMLSESSRFGAMGSGKHTNPVPVVSATISGRTAELVGRTTDGIEVRRTITPRDSGEGCAFDIVASWKNLTSTAYAGDVWMLTHDALPEESGRYANAARPYASTSEGVEYWQNLSKLEEPKPYEGKVSWFGIADNYFGAFLVPEEATGSIVFDTYITGEISTHGARYVVKDGLAPGASHSETLALYIGPKTTESLTAAAPQLGDAIQLGWFAFFGRILLWALKTAHGVVGNWGLAIICLTMVVKGLFFPLTQMAFRSGEAMKRIQPQLQAIREKHKDSPETLNKETIELFRKNKVNPVGGCLPMLIQMPVWFALYSVLLYSVEVYHTSFLYLRDLSAIDPTGALPLVVVVLMMVQQSFMPTGNMDPAQARIMKLMPLIFGFFFFTFPAGLVVYIFVNMVLTILQQWYIRRTFSAAPEPALDPTTT